MLDLLWLVPTIPFIGFLALMLSAGKMPPFAAGLVGAGSIGLSFLVACLVGVSYLNMEPTGEGIAYTQTLWTWLRVGDFSAGFSFYLDGLSLVMMFIITGVGFLIHVYATGYMKDDPGFARFFCYMNLFVAAMLILVLGDNLLLLFMGWEGVGLCSYLLIGFWYKDPHNGYAARKAFVMTRVGDASMALGLLLIFMSLGTLDIQTAMSTAESQWQPGSGMAVAITLLLLGGAVGKSAQLPLQTWLPDAMAGPTPISALIHAATMVTAGVYLIARTHVFYELAPSVQYLIGVIGVLTLLMAGFTALVQNDIKKVLAFSTVSQIGYMFLALGVGAWSSAVFHLMTHAFFKALLFLTAGSIILSMHHEQNIFKMGGLRRDLPFCFWMFLIGCLALTALPLTSGFFSKEEILAEALASPDGGYLLWLGGLAGAFLTGLYSFRLLFLVFFGEKRHAAEEMKGSNLQLPLVILAVFSILGGYIALPLDSVFPHAEHEAHPALHYQIIMIAVPMLGILLAWYLFVKRKDISDRLATDGMGKTLHRFFFSQWGMDWLYSLLFIKPYVWLSRINRRDFVDAFYNGTAGLARFAHGLLSDTQTGHLRWYVFCVGVGLLLLVSIGVFA